MIHGYRFTALGCTGRIRIAHCDKQHADHAICDAVRWLRQTEALLSRFIETSAVSQLNRGKTIARSPILESVLLAGKTATQLTAGRFSLFTDPLWQLWHDPQRHKWPTHDEMHSARDRGAAQKLIYTNSTVALASQQSGIDIGGIGKEWCVDQLLKQLTEFDINNVIIELGGDCAARGHQPHADGWHVLIPGAAAAVTLHNEAIATSGIGTRGRWLDGHWIPHLINALTGLPAPGIVRSATIIAPSCERAGIHASDLCLLIDMSPVLVQTSNGSFPTWLRIKNNINDDTWWANEDMAKKLTPVTNTTAAA